MPDIDRRQDELDQLVDAYARQRMKRRQFMQRALALGFSTSTAASLLVACDENSTSIGSSHTSTPTSIDVLNVWSGEEQASFKAVVAPFTSRYHIAVHLESTRDLDAILTTRLRGNNPPAIAILPNPGKMRQLASQQRLVALDQFLDIETLRSQYEQSWIDLGSYKGSLYALFYKATNKGTIWYSPQQFHKAGLQIPTTWQELIGLSNQLASKGKYPWSMGVSNGAASGWPATDWLAEIYLNQAGRDMYDRWWSHQIPWTDSSVKDAFKTFGQIVSGKHYINGAPRSILTTDFQSASYAPFSNPPRAYMYYLGDFTAGFISGEFPQLQPGTDFNFFPFPAINPQYRGSITVGADVVVALKDNSAVRQLVRYLATPDAQAIWVKRGGFISPNKALDLQAYPNAVARASAQMLTTATTFRFGAGDLMAPAVQQAFWRGMLTFIADQSQLDTVLSSIEAVARQASK